MVGNLKVELIVLSTPADASRRLVRAYGQAVCARHIFPRVRCGLHTVDRRQKVHNRCADVLQAHPRAQDKLAGMFIIDM